ncbi:hypothetical protein [Ruegeria lacuscaerulensis]|uniref:hypothetical protein n=1 Tax=Ruegeria lacuscaerulensis TaxID=55218 RepID=UPI001479A1A8|nr:hypothetical protein [Ruegeria lacuscaerulensis]
MKLALVSLGSICTCFALYVFATTADMVTTLSAVFGESPDLITLLQGTVTPAPTSILGGLFFGGVFFTAANFVDQRTQT